MKELGFLKKVFIYMLLPFSVLKNGAKLMFTRKERNGISKGAPLKGKKNGAFTKDIPLEKLKEISRDSGYTINDIIMALTGLVLKKYLMSVGDTKTKHLHLGVPFSIRETPKSKKDLQLRNDFSIMKIKLEVSEDFDFLLRKVQKRMDDIKNSLDPFGVYYFI